MVVEVQQSRKSHNAMGAFLTWIVLLLLLQLQLLIPW
jgi:hypothetical protein